MSTYTANVAALYEDIIADLVPYYDNAVLLPQLAGYTFNIEGGMGNQVRVPVTNAWDTANSSVGENSPIIANSSANADFEPTSVDVSTVKRGIGTLVSSESLEDGGQEQIRQAVLTRLSQSMAQSTDITAVNTILSGAEADLVDLSDMDLTNDGYVAAEVSGCDLAIVMSEESWAHASKRSAQVQMFNDVDQDNFQFVGTVRNGHARVKPTFARGLAFQTGIGATGNVATLDKFSTSIANLRAVNAPTDGAGFYTCLINPAMELALAKELNGVGGIASGSIGSVAQGLANDALLRNLLSFAIGGKFIRSNNLPTNITST